MEEKVRNGQKKGQSVIHNKLHNQQMRRPKTQSVEEKIYNMILTSGFKSVLLCVIKQLLEERANYENSHRVSLD